MIPKHNVIVLIFGLCAAFHCTVGGSIVNGRSANDTDNDNDDDDEIGIIASAKDVMKSIMDYLRGNENENVFDEAMKNISGEIDKYIDLVPDVDEEETTEVYQVDTVDGYDVKTENIVINGTIGNQDAELQIQENEEGNNGTESLEGAD
ncbi:uncharacterized protein LOC117333707 isoform X2 [Pecten maximus]|uniref:uncharacterized protein LOC117333707 isoform X2 n=1 Tax=Pecten maximus TaxID=6579 RepID=UPI0014584965|nr:uncharacterized protein LOC117333707 isoform X2 [Pecten maximus]